MLSEYRCIRTSVITELKIKKSHFVAYAEIVKNEKEARSFITEVKNRNSEASHHTYAYVVKDKVLYERYSDDGEPHGTAGLPILEVLKRQELTNTIVAVTRYFGGIKLGTGGLARAYTRSAVDCLKKAGIVKYFPGFLIRIDVDYHNLGKVKNSIEKSGCTVISEEYADNVIIMAQISQEEYTSFIRKISDITSAAAKIEKVGERYIKAEG